MYGGLEYHSQKKDDDEDYDFDINIDVGGTRALTTSLGQAGSHRPIGTAFAGNAPTSRMGHTPAGRLFTSRSNGDVRPMTSVSGAGYQSGVSASGGSSFDPLNASSKPAPPLVENIENRGEDIAKEMERQIHRLIEESARLCMEHDLIKALEKAKEAGKKERLLVKHRESNGLADQQNPELTYATWFNLATTYEKSEMYEEALNAYSYLVKQKKYPSSGRLRANMGNIYFSQKNYPQAVKMYRMALDQIPNAEKQIGFKICRNIGNAFVKLGKFRDAIQSYETVMGASPDYQTSFNLILCYFALGDVDKMKRGFTKMLAIPFPQCAEVDADDAAGPHAKRKYDETRRGAHDLLDQELLRRKKEAESYILRAARLIAPKVDRDSWTGGYRWVYDQLKNDREDIAHNVEIEQAIQHLKRKEFDDAVKILKSFEKKEPEVMAIAATNLSFIYFLEGDVPRADEYADMAVRGSRYNSKALVNKANCLFSMNEFDRAKELYLEAIGVEADCFEAIYNLGLTNIRMDLPDEARQAFEKLHTIVPNNPAVIYQIANLREAQGQHEQATKWFNVLVSRVPTDPGVLSRLGHIFSKAQDENQGCHYQLESYRNYPVNLDVISWLGVWFVKHEMYEKSIHFFERAAQVQPDEIKWRLMVTSCYRRMGNYSKAIQLYEQIHEEHPENIECIRYLIAICKDLGRPYEEFQQKLSHLGQQQKTSQMQGSKALPTTTGPKKSVSEVAEEEKTTKLQEPIGIQSKAPSAPVPSLLDHSERENVAEREEEDFSDADVNDLLA